MTDIAGLRLSNSKLKTWRRCPNKYRYKYVMKLEPKRKSLPLERGTWLHSLLEEHYNGGDWMELHQEKSKEFYGLFEEEQEALGELPVECERIMRAYLWKYKNEDEGLKVIDTELDEILTMPSGLEFNFIIDMIVEDENGYWLWDHKTVKSFMDEDFMLLDAQLARYFWCAEQMGYKPLQGVMFNELRTKPPAVPELLKSGRLSERKNMDTDYYTYFRAIKAAGHNPGHYRDTLERLARSTDRFFRRTFIPKDKPLTERLMVELDMGAEEIVEAVERDRFPRSAEKTCTWDCEFRDVCQVELMGADPSSIIKQNFRRRQRPE